MTDHSAPTIGQPAPPVTVTAPDGTPIAIDQLWRDSPGGLALLFLRHYGCPFCKEHARAINNRRADFAAAGIVVLLVGCGTLEEAKVFQAAYAPELTLGNDAERVAYGAYGLGEAKLSSLVHPKMLAGGIRAATKGFLPKSSVGNPLQLQGQFLIDQTGTVRVADRPALMSEIPSPDALLAAARSLVPA